MQTSIQTPMQIGCHPRTSQHRPPTPRISYSVLIGCLLLSTVHAGALAIPVPFTHRDNTSQHRQIENLEQDWRKALLASNIPAMDHRLADDYLGVTANGTLETKADLLAMRSTGTMRISEMTLSDLKVRVYGDTAVVTSRAELAGTNGGTDIGGYYRYTRVYNRRNGEWRIVSFEASRITDGRKH